MKIATAFDELRADEYAEAVEARELGKLCIRETEEHAHLRDVSIGYLFRDDEIRRHGKVIDAECILVDRILQADKRWSRFIKWSVQRILGTIPDFLVLIDRNLWSGYSVEEKAALIDHELSHAFYQTEDDGETPKLHKDGTYVLAIRGHDVEEFCGVIERRGLWRPDLVPFARAIVDSLAASGEPTRRVHLSATA